MAVPAAPLADTIDAKVLLSVLARIKEGDLTARMPLEWTGLAGKVADGLNDVIIANEALGAELARVSQVVGKEGRLSQRVVLGGLTQRWSGPIESVNNLIDDLVRPTIEMQRVIGAVADGDLSKKVSADVRGEMLELKNTINAMVDQLNGFISEVTRVAREVGTEGKLGQAEAVTIEVGGVWKDLTDDVNLMAGNLTGQLRNIAEVTTAVANGDLQQEDLDRRQGRVPGTEEHRQRHGRPAQRVRRRGDEGRPRGGRRGQAGRPGAIEGSGRRLEGPHRQRQPARRQPHQPGASDLRGGHRGHRGRPHPPGERGGERRGCGPEGQAQRDDPEPARDHQAEHRTGLVEDEPGTVHPHAPGSRRSHRGVEHDPVGARHAGLGTARRLLLDGQLVGRRRLGVGAAGRLRVRRAEASLDDLPAR